MKTEKLCGALGMVMALPAMPALGQTSFQGLGGLAELPGGGVYSEAFAVSADGTTVVGFSLVGTDQPEAFRWKAGEGMQGLGDLSGGDFHSAGYGVSGDGAVVVGASLNMAGTTSAFRWTAAEGMQPLPTPDANSVARAVSADGSVIAGSSKSQAVRWTTASGMVSLGYVPPLTSGVSAAYGISADGSVIVGISSAPDTGSWSDGTPGSDAFRWTAAGGLTGLHAAGPYCQASGDETWRACGSVAEDVSADGKVVVGSASTTAEWCYIGDWGQLECYADGWGWVFRWTAQTGAVDLGMIGYSAGAAGVSADGSIVVGGGDDVNWVAHALIWDAVHGPRKLQDVLVNEYGLGSQLAGWHLWTASGISDDGNVIVGTGTNPTGNREAWRVVLNPPAATVPGDFDRDCDVDSADYAVFHSCASGPAIPYAVDCAKADLDSDGDADQSDFAIFQRCYSGEGNPADPNCNDTCFGEGCDCPCGQTNCGGMCTFTESDHNNCGVCGNVCPAGTVCENASCVASPCTGYCEGFCAGTCVNLCSDAANCGTCGNECAADELCVFGGCTGTCSGCQ